MYKLVWWCKGKKQAREIIWSAAVGVASFFRSLVSALLEGCFAFLRLFRLQENFRQQLGILRLFLPRSGRSSSKNSSCAGAPSFVSCLFVASTPSAELPPEGKWWWGEQTIQDGSVYIRAVECTVREGFPWRSQMVQSSSTVLDRIPKG